MVRYVEINYIFKHPFEAVSRAYFQKVSFFYMRFTKTGAKINLLNALYLNEAEVFTFTPSYQLIIISNNLLCIYSSCLVLSINN